MKNQILLLSLFVLSISFSFAQTNTIVNVLVKGQVVDSLTNETIPYATIKVSGTGNGAPLLKAVAADDNGKFQFTMNKKGDYILAAEFIGKTTVVKSLVIDNTKTVDFGKLVMADNTQALSEVVVSAQRPLVQVDLDKITYSMESDPESKTNNVLEMLKKVPMVTVDGDENVQLKGSSNFKIYLNGKPSNMISNNPKDVLRSMPANTIKDIQVITDPGAKYDAEGVAGIINIITQKDSSMGGYTATLNSRVDTNGGFGGGAYGSFKYGKVGFTGNYGYYDWKRPKGVSSSLRENLIDSDNKYLRENGFSKNTGHGQYGSGEFSYEIDTLNLINVGFNRYHGNGNSTSDIFVDMQNISNNREYGYDRETKGKSVYGGTDMNVDYQRTFNKKDQLLTASYKLSLNPNDSESTTLINNVEGNLPSRTVTNRQYSDADMKEHTFQIDFVTPFDKVHSLETGAKYIIRINQSTSAKDTLDASGIWNYDPNPNNDRFKHQQDILAAYGGYSAKFNKWGIKTGLRYEATWLDARFPLVTNANFKSNYSNIVPSATITYQLKPMQSIRLGYNMRISRPGIWQLNPYYNDSNPLVVSQGNPELDAVKTHSVSLNYNYFNPSFNMNANLSYDFENNTVEDITSYETKLGNSGEEYSFYYTTYKNIGKRKNLGLSTYVNWNITSKFRVYSNLSGRYVDIKANDATQANNGFTGNMYMGAQYTFPKALRANFNGGYFSPYLNLQGKGSAFSFHGFSLSKGFKDEKLTFRVYVDSPFQKDRTFKDSQNTPIYRYESQNTIQMRRFGFAVSFRFGEMKSQIKKAQRSISNDDSMGGGQGQQQGGGQPAGQ